MGKRLEYALFRVACALARRMSAAFRWKCAGAAARAASALHLKRMRIAEGNIRAAMPGLPAARVRAIAFDAARSLFQTFFELPLLARATSSQLVKMVTTPSVPMVRRVLGKYKRAIFLSAHFGNWELAAMTGPLYFACPFAIVGKPQRNEFVNGFLDRMRERAGNSVIPMDGALRPMMRSLAEGCSIALLADQSATRQDMFVEFFGRRAPTYEAAAALAIKMDVPLLFGLAVRQPDLTYAVRIEEIPRDDLREYTKENVRILTERHVQALERAVRENPGQWLWAHRRWKHGECDSSNAS